MVITHNISAMNAQRNLGNNQKAITGNLEKMSSGYKINRAADDASGLCTSEKMRASISQLDVCVDNCEMGRNLVRVADGAIEEIHAMCNRMVELSVLSANGTFDDEVDRAALQEEVNQLVEEIDRIVETTNYNGIYLLNREDVIEEIVTNNWIEDIQDVVIYEDSVFYAAQSSSRVATIVETNAMVSSSSTTVLSSQNYYSDSYSIPSAALSVPADADLPYTIEMTITVYNDDTSTVGSSEIAHKVVSLTVDQDASGGTIVTGTAQNEYVNGTTGNLINISKDESDIFYQTDKDVANAAAGSDTTTYFINNSDPNYLVTAGEMQIFMESLLNSMPYNLYTGGDSGSNSAEYMYGADTAKWTAAGYSYNSKDGWTYPSSGAYAGKAPSQFLTEQYTSAELAGISGSPTYGSSMYCYGQSTVQTGRVIGMTVSVSDGNTTIASSETPSGFDPDAWSSSSDLREAAAGSILGVTQVAEPARSEVKLDESGFKTGDELAAMTAEERLNYVITLTQLQEYSLNPDGDLLTGTIPDGSGEYPYVEVEEKYAIVFNPFVEDLFDPDVILISGYDLIDACYAVDELCDAIENGVTDTANRKLDSVDHVALDDNVTNRYTIELAPFYPEINYYKDYVEVQDLGDWERIYESVADPIIIQAGEHSEEYDRIYIYIDSMRDEVEMLKSVDISEQGTAQGAVDTVKEVVNLASLVRSDLGAYENRLEIAANVDRTVMEYLQAAETKIRDTDFAEEMMAYTSNSILIESSQAMLAQANNLPQGVLQLLG